MNASQSSPIEILMVEDSETDVLITKEALSNAKVANIMNVVEDGVEAMAYLRQEGKYEDCTRPDLILLDLNLPKKDGREVLQEIRSIDHLKHIPVVILTTSNDEQDVLRSYKLAANCYVTKPVDFHQFIEVVRSIESFWFTVVKLPR